MPELQGWCCIKATQRKAKYAEQKLECHGGRIGITSDAIIHKLTKQRGEARGLASRGTRPAVLGNNVRWIMAVFLALETKSLRWATYVIQIGPPKQEIGDEPRHWSCLMHTGREMALSEGTQHWVSRGDKRLLSLSLSVANVDHSIFFIFCLFSLLGLFIT